MQSFWVQSCASELHFKMKMNNIFAHLYIIWAFEYSPVFKIKHRSTCALLSYHHRSEADDYSPFQCFLEEWQVCIIAMPKRFFIMIIIEQEWIICLELLWVLFVHALQKKIDRAEIIRKLYYIYKTKCNIDWF